VNTTSFAVIGEYDRDLDAHTIAVTYGYSRDHRADLKQWTLALATTRAGDVPLFCKALDGNASDQVSLVAAVEALAEQLRTQDEDEAATPIFVADSGLYSADNVTRLHAAGVRWISRVPDTSTAARAALVVMLPRCGGEDLVRRQPVMRSPPSSHRRLVRGSRAPNGAAAGGRSPRCPQRAPCGLPHGSATAARGVSE
jgi:transposase